MGAGSWPASLTQSTSPGKQPQGRGPKEIGGSLLKRWGMWFNSTVHGAPYQPPWRPAPALTCGRGGPPSGAAWLSSVRAARCGLGSPNERNPRVGRLGPAGPLGPQPLGRPPTWRGGGALAPRPVGAAEVKSIWPRSAGLHTCHKGRLNGPPRRQPSRTPNRGPSSDCALQVARMKLKPLVIVHQQVTVKLAQALHTPPITLGKCVTRERPWGLWPAAWAGWRGGRSERS